MQIGSTSQANPNPDRKTRYEADAVDDEFDMDAAPAAPLDPARLSRVDVLIANRGEIAVRIQRAAAALDIATVAIYSEDDAQGLHFFRADHAHALTGAGAAAYLDIAQVIAAALPG